MKCNSVGTCGVVRGGSFNLAALVFKNGGLNPGDFNESSPVVITVNGRELYSGVLGDDPKYSAGKRGGTLIKSHVDSTTGKTMVDLKIVITGTRAGVNVRIIGKISSHQPPVVADQYLGMNGTINDLLSGDVASIRLGNYYDSTGSAGIAGKATVKNVTKRGQPFTLDTVRIHAVAVP